MWHRLASIVLSLLRVEPASVVCCRAGAHVRRRGRVAKGRMWRTGAGFAPAGRRRLRRL